MSYPKVLSYLIFSHSKVRKFGFIECYNNGQESVTRDDKDIFLTIGININKP